MFRIANSRVNEPLIVFFYSSIKCRLLISFGSNLIKKEINSKASPSRTFFKKKIKKIPQMFGFFKRKCLFVCFLTKLISSIYEFCQNLKVFERTLKKKNILKIVIGVDFERFDILKHTKKSKK